MKRQIFILTLISLVTTSAFGQETLECLDVKFKIRGYIYAGTSFKDTLALGGFAEASNHPRKIENNLFPSGQLTILCIKSDTSKFYTEDGRKWKGRTVFVFNTTGKAVQFDAQDSRLNMTCEVYYNDQWQELEYLPSSWCGNSYHSVFLDNNEYWTFEVPCYTGSVQTLLRYKLVVNKYITIYSHEFDGGFNPKALKKMEGHKRKNVMDSYNN